MTEEKEKTMKLQEQKTDLDDLILVLHCFLLRSQLLADICILHTHAHQGEQRYHSHSLCMVHQCLCTWQQHMITSIASHHFEIHLSLEKWPYRPTGGKSNKHKQQVSQKTWNTDEPETVPVSTNWPSPGHPINNCLKDNCVNKIRQQQIISLKGTGFLKKKKNPTGSSIIGA